MVIVVVVVFFYVKVTLNFQEIVNTSEDEISFQMHAVAPQVETLWCTVCKLTYPFRYSEHIHRLIPYLLILNAWDFHIQAIV